MLTAEREPATSAPAEVRISLAIADMNARGLPVRSPQQLVNYLADCLEAVRTGQHGFDLSHVRTSNGEAETFPPGGIRFFYGGSVADPDDVEGGPAASARAIAEEAVEHVRAAGHAATTLEQLGDASTIDRLNLWDDDLADELEDELATLAEERPALAEQIRDQKGNPDLQKLASLVWREGLSVQYAREADGQVGVINTAPFEGQTWFQNERPAALDNGHTTRDDIAYIGFTHAPLSRVDAANGQKSEPLPEFTGPMTDSQADPYITFPPPQTKPDDDVSLGYRTHADLEELLQHAITTRDNERATRPRPAVHRPSTHPQYAPTQRRTPGPLR